MNSFRISVCGRFMVIFERLFFLAALSSKDGVQKNYEIIQNLKKVRSQLVEIREELKK